MGGWIIQFWGLDFIFFYKASWSTQLYFAWVEDLWPLTTLSKSPLNLDLCKVWWHPLLGREAAQKGTQGPDQPYLRPTHPTSPIPHPTSVSHISAQMWTFSPQPCILETAWTYVIGILFFAWTPHPDIEACLRSHLQPQLLWLHSPDGFWTWFFTCLL